MLRPEYTPLCLERCQDPEALLQWLPGLITLMSPWLPLLEGASGESLANPETVFANLVGTLPCLWILYDRTGTVAGAACLSGMIPGRHAFLHGVRALAYRKHPALRQLVSLIFHEAFETLNLRKLKAEFEADNRGALGFCRLHGFIREAHFREEVVNQGRLTDILVYSLFRSQYFNRQEALHSHGIC